MATSMDLADKIELDQVVSFPYSHTSWTIIERLSPYPTYTGGPNYMPQSDSFNHSYVFRVELAGSGDKLVPDYIPKFAVVKIKSSATVPLDAIDADLLREIRALEQLTLNECTHAPRILDAKIEHHLTSMRNWQPPEGEEEERQHFVTYILMTEITGKCLKGDVFWKLDDEQRKLIRMAFRSAMSDIHRNWVVLTEPNPKHLIWNKDEQTLYFVNFEKSLTFNNLGLMHDTVQAHVSRTLPTRFQAWNNAWYADWGLSKDVISLFTKSTDGTTFEEDWEAKYAETVLVEPKMPKAGIAGLLLGKGGERIAMNEEKKEYAIQLETFQKMQKEGPCEIM